MLAIHKNTEDPLRQHRSQQNATYGNIPETERVELVDSLLKEQGYLCAYCMCRIKTPLVKVEHWKCRDNYPTLQIEYNNLLAVCCENSGQNASRLRCENERGVTPAHQHCDTKKGSANLDYNPANTAHHQLIKIKYTETTGKILSENARFNEQLSDVLNLNIEFHKSNRLNILNAIKGTLKKYKVSATTPQLQLLLTQWKNKNKHGQYQPFAGIAIWYLEKRLRKVQ